MLMDFAANKTDRPCMCVEGEWLGNSFDEFLQRIPKEHLCNQLYMFSARYDINEAVERIAGLSHYFFTEEFSNGVDELSKKTGLDLEAVHLHKTSYRAPISKKSIENLREMLEEEYVFFDRIRELQAA